jgi:hypothetical protein
VILWHEIFLLSEDFDFVPSCHGVWGDSPAAKDNRPAEAIMNLWLRLGWTVIEVE